MRTRLILLLGSLALLAGCGGPNPSTSNPSTSNPNSPTSNSAPLSGSGVLTGKVRFLGRLPKLAPVVMDAVPACARQYPGEIPSQELELTADSAVKNAFVYISAGLPAGATYPPAEGPVKIDQKACVYSPRVVGLRTGQTLEVTNSDPISHNVKPAATRNQPWSESQPPNGPVIRRSFNTPEQMVTLKCNLHPWMAAHIGVMEHPYFAVSSADGSFRIANLPPGEYTVTVWQERLGKTEAKVQVGNGNTEADLTFSK